MWLIDSPFFGEKVPIPEQPLGDLTEMQEWKWSVRKAKKINQELHSQRCDVELKLSVRFLS